MDVKRRDFLRSSIASLTGANVVGAAKAFAQDETTTKQPKYPFSTDPVARIKLTPLIETSRIGFGTGMAGHNRQSNLTRMDRKKAEKLLLYAYDRGVRFFDCADLYGTHEIVSTTLKDKPRDSYTLSSKIWPHPGGIPEAERPDADVVVKRFLQELKTDYLDLVQVHCMMKPDWQGDMQRYFEPLEKLKEQGLIRGHGISVHNVGAVRTAASDPWVDAIHIRLNTHNERMDGTFEENVAAAQSAQDAGKGIICMKLVGEGRIPKLEDRQRSIDAVVRSQVVDVYIVGFDEIWQIDELIDNIGSSLKAMESERK